MKAVTGALVCAAALLLVPSHARAQDHQWSAWLGCWEMTNENVQSGEGGLGALWRSSADEPAIEAPPRTCVTPLGEHGVTVTTTVPDQEPVTQTLIPDGVARPIADKDCRGTEQTEWSASGRRLFARAEVTCDDGAPRFISGLALITPDHTWLDIRTFRIDSRTTTRISRYRKVEAGKVAAPAAGHPPLTLAEIKDASAHVSAAAIEAALAETRPGVPVNRRTLLELDEANVPDSVIDLMVALAYPDQFVIDRPARVASARLPLGVDPLYPFGIDDYYYSGYYYPAYYYSPFAYSYLGRYDPFLFGPAFGYIGPPFGGGIPAPPDSPTASGTGRVINNEGYTRVRPADSGDRAVPRARAGRGSSGGDSDRSTTTRSVGGTAPSSPPADGGSSGSSGGGGASPQGYSGGGDGGGGRTAQPR